jgi:hypothetical protein
VSNSALEERWVPVGEDEEEWEPRTYEEALLVMERYPLGFSWGSDPGSGDPGGIKFIRKETRTVTSWEAISKEFNSNKEEK